MKRAAVLGCLWAVAGGISFVVLPSQALGRGAGIPAEGCTGCHSGGREPMVTFTADPPNPAPGASVLLTLRVSRTNGGAGGFFITSRGKGAFAEATGTPVRFYSAERTEVSHPSTRVSSSGDLTFQVRWTAPTAPGAADIDAWGLSSDGGGNARNDAETFVRLGIAYGCEGKAVYQDQDGDGYGVTGFFGPTFTCNPGKEYAARGGDCHDGSAVVNPAATEICNGQDDDCDGTIDEGLPAVELIRDRDGDGFGPRTGEGETKMGCDGTPGWSAKRTDCNDEVKEIFPGSPETCNNRDDDCDGRVDDGARATCGEGWCRRSAVSCDPTSCTPGPPRAEMCNAFDDDCDGVIDNGPVCPSGSACIAGMCVVGGVLRDAGAPPRDAGSPPIGNSADAGASPTPTDDPGMRPRPEPSSGGCAVAAGVDGGGLVGVALWLVAFAALRRRRS